MNFLERLFYVGFVLGICLLILSICFLFIWLKTKKEVKQLKKRKKKMKKHRYIKEKRNLEKKKKRFSIVTFSMLLLGTLLIAGASYARYYQTMTLSSDDSDAIVKSYFLLNDLEDELKKGKNGEVEEPDFNKKVTFLATSLASYGIKSANTNSSKDGQLLINRYYTYTADLGRNLNNQATQLLKDPDQIDEYLSDLKKVKDRQKKVFTYYKVNESNLKENK